MKINHSDLQRTKCFSLHHAKKYFHAVCLLLLFLAASPLFQACTTIKTLQVKGTVATQNNRTFSLSALDNFLIKPGKLNIELMEHSRNYFFFGYTSSSILQIWNDEGKVNVDYPPEWKVRILDHYFGKLDGNKVCVTGISQGLMYNIDVTWEDHSEEIFNIQRMESCTYEEGCWENYSETVCDSKGKNCHNETKSRWTTCTRFGSQKVQITNEKYKRSYALNFVSPENNADVFGHFEGTSGVLQRQIAKKELTSCM